MEVKYVTFCGNVNVADFIAGTAMLFSFLSNGQLFITKDNKEGAGELDIAREKMSSGITLLAVGTIKNGVVGDLDESAYPASLEVLTKWNSRFNTPYAA